MINRPNERDHHENALKRCFARGCCAAHIDRSPRDPAVGWVGPLFEHPRRRHAGAVSEESVVLDIDDSGLARNLPRPVHRNDEIQGVPYRPVGFRDDDLPSALERSARWLRDVQEWLGEAVDVIGVHLDYDDSADGIYYEVKLLCNDEDLAGVPIALRARRSSPE